MDLCMSLHSEHFAASRLPFETIVMASLVCPELESEERRSRAPIDLCCVLDKSGSMAGKKLELMKKAVQFVIEQLKESDRLTIVLFDTNVSTVVKLQAMDKEGKAAAIRTVSDIRDGSSTNLSGGLFEALEILKRREEGHQVTSVLLFTDGLANHGITGTAEIVSGIQTTLAAMEACAIFSFGFGDDHDPKMLSAISEAAHGQYYYIKREDEIPQAFGECIGGLLSVAAQNVKLSFECREGCSLQQVLAEYPQQDTTATSTQLVIGDMYSEEKKDLLFRVMLPAVLDETEGHEVAKVTLTFFSAVESKLQTLDGVFCIRRTGDGPVSNPNPEIDRQRNRVTTTHALKTANELGERNQLAEARGVIEAAVAQVRQSATAEDPFCQALVQDMTRLLGRLQNHHEYRSKGHKMLSNMVGCHGQQRCTENAWDDEEPQLAQQMYTTSSKMACRSKAM